MLPSSDRTSEAGGHNEQFEISTMIECNRIDSKTRDIIDSITYSYCP